MYKHVYTHTYFIHIQAVGPEPEEEEEEEEEDLTERLQALRSWSLIYASPHLTLSIVLQCVYTD